MEETFIIIKSKKKGQPNWSGKEFSTSPAKIYTSFLDAVESLKSYWFNDFSIEKNGADKRTVTIIHLPESKKISLLANGKIRW